VCAWVETACSIYERGGVLLRRMGLGARDLRQRSKAAEADVCPRRSFLTASIIGVVLTAIISVGGRRARNV